MGCGVQRCDILVDSPANSEPTNFKKQKNSTTSPPTKTRIMYSQEFGTFFQERGDVLFYFPNPKPKHIPKPTEKKNNDIDANAPKML